jgi:hypothetical protein
VALELTTQPEKGTDMTQATTIVTRIKNRGGVYINVHHNPAGRKNADHHIECTGCGHTSSPTWRPGAQSDAERHAGRCAFEPAEG